MNLIPNSLTVGYITGGSNKDAFLRSLWNFRLDDEGADRVWQDADLIEGKGLYVDNNRNDVVNRFMERPKNKELFLYVDTDMIFDPEAIYMLISTLDPIKRPIISGFYGAWRRDTLYPEWWDYDEKLGYIPTSTFKGAEGELQKLAACGMGLCLIHRSVFEKFPILDGDNWRWFGRDLGLQEGKRKHLDEDITFCKRAGELNIPIYGNCYTASKILHLKESTVGFQTWLDQIKLQQIK